MSQKELDRLKELQKIWHLHLNLELSDILNDLDTEIDNLKE